MQNQLRKRVIALFQTCIFIALCKGGHAEIASFYPSRQYWIKTSDGQNASEQFDSLTGNTTRSLTGSNGTGTATLRASNTYDIAKLRMDESYSVHTTGADGVGAFEICAFYNNFKVTQRARYTLSVAIAQGVGSFGTAGGGLQLAKIIDGSSGRQLIKVEAMSAGYHIGSNFPTDQPGTVTGFLEPGDYELAGEVNCGIGYGSVGPNGFATMNYTLEVGQIDPPAYLVAYNQPWYDTRYPSGHAFLQLITSEGEGTYYGFYPSGNSLKSDGKITNEAPSWSYGISYPLTAAQYRSAAAAVTRDYLDPPYYHLFGFNCLDWVGKIATAAGVSLPPYRLPNGTADPHVFGQVLATIGVGNKFYGGTVIQQGGASSPAWISDPTKPYDFSVTAIGYGVHLSPQSVASSLGLPMVSLSMGTITTDESGAVTIHLSGATTEEALISMSWGDGATIEIQPYGLTHVYSPGTYTARLFVADDGALRSYEWDVSVSTSASGQTSVSADYYPPAIRENPGLGPALPVPGYSHVLSYGLEKHLNGNFLIRGLGFPGFQYTIQASDDLDVFEDVGNVTADSTGLFQLLDPDSGSKRARFYRIAYP